MPDLAASQDAAFFCHGPDSGAHRSSSRSACVGNRDGTAHHSLLYAALRDAHL